MTFKLFTELEANTIASHIVELYSQSHNIPLVGKGVILPITPERQRNRTSQAEYRAQNSRFTVWITSDTAGIIEPVIQKIVALKSAKKEYRAAVGLLHRHERELIAITNKVINTVVTVNNTQAKIDAKILAKQKAIADKNNQIVFDNQQVAQTFDLYQNLIE